MYTVCSIFDVLYELGGNIIDSRDIKILYLCPCVESVHAWIGWRDRAVYKQRGEVVSLDCFVITLFFFYRSSDRSWYSHFKSLLSVWVSPISSLLTSFEHLYWRAAWAWTRPLLLLQFSNNNKILMAKAI